MVREGSGWYRCEMEEDDMRDISGTVPDTVVPNPYHSFLVDLFEEPESVRY